MFSRFICHEGQRWLSQDAPRKRPGCTETKSRTQSWTEVAFAMCVCMNLCVSACLPFSLSLGLHGAPIHIFSVHFCLVLPIFLVLILIISAHNCCPGPKSTSWLFNSVPKANLLRFWISSVLNSKRTERGSLLLFTQTHLLEITTSLIGHV